MTTDSQTEPNVSLGCSLGGFDWVDNDPTLWPLFVHWLTEKWYSLYRHAFNELPGVEREMLDSTESGLEIMLPLLIATSEI